MTAALKPTTDRRKLLTTGLAAGLLAASGLSLTSRPQVGGRLRAGLPGAALSDSWDATKGFGLFMAAAGHGAVFDCLTEVAADGSLRGELAIGWHASKDAKTWVFDLRSGVKFHDGTPFDSASVVESIRLHLDAGPSGAGWHLVSDIDTIKANSPTQVQFSLRSGNADFPYLLSDRHLIMYPAGKIAAAIAQGIGTGLYRVAMFEAGRRFLGWRVSDHFKDGTAGWFDQIELLAVEDPVQRLALAQSGRVDAAAQIDPIHAQNVINDPSMRLSNVPGNQHLALDASALPNAALSAFKSAVNRESVLLTGLYGYGHLGNDSPIGPFNQYYNSQPSTGFDPEFAASKLASAGLSGLGIDLSALGSVPTSLGLALWPSLLAAGFSDAKTHKVTAKMWSGRVIEDWMFGANGNLGGNSIEYEALRAQARAEFDPILRADHYANLQLNLQAAGPVIIPAFANFLQGISKRIAEPATQGNLWPMDNARFAERWWLS